MAPEFSQNDLHASSRTEKNSFSPAASSTDDAYTLMSLALDGMLSDDEAKRFNQLLEHNLDFAREWKQWRALDSQLLREPSITPPADFVVKVNQRLDDEPSESEDFIALMSLALDGRLNKEDEQRFHGYMEQNATLANQWQVWQELDHRLTIEPSLLPPANFVGKVNQRLSLEMRRQKLWLAAGVGSTIAAVWVVIFLALAFAVSFIVTNQGVWLGDQIHNLTHLTATATAWLVDTSIAIDRTISGTLSYPQLWGMLAGYVLFSGLILVLWTKMLRRSISQIATQG